MIRARVIHSARSFARLQLALFAMLLCLPLSFFSQKNVLQNADQLMNDKKYNEAITLYKQVYDKKKEKPVLLKLADANYLNENYQQAQLYYSDYFSDTVYQDIPQFTNYANSAKSNGNLKLATQLYLKLYEKKQDPAAKSNYDLYTLYLDTTQKIRTYDLDSSYNCIDLDAGESVDPLASPLVYVWTFEDSTVTEGIRFEHCFTTGGLHKIMLSARDQQTGIVRINDTTITVFTEEPPVKFKAPRTGKRYLPVDFDASSTVLNNYDISEYIWNMDNGDIRMGRKIKYRYPNFGNYSVKLTIVAKNKSSGRTELLSSTKRIEITENYNSGKSFTDQRNDAK